MYLVVRSPIKPASLLAMIKDTIARIDPNQPVYNSMLMETVLSDSVAPSPFAPALGPTAAHRSVTKAIDSMRTPNGITFNQKLSEANLLGAKPQHGDMGIADACVLQPGSAEKSLLLHRMTLTNEKRMPRVGSNVVDEEGVKLIREWIEKMPKP